MKWVKNYIIEVYNGNLNESESEFKRKA